MGSSEDTTGRIGDLLLQQGKITPLQLEFALQTQQVTGEYLGELLQRLGIVFDHDLAHLLAEHRDIPFINVDTVLEPDAQVLNMFNQKVCLNHAFLPVRRGDNMLEVILGNADPDDVKHIVSQRSGLRPRFFQGEFVKVVRAIRQHYYFTSNPVEKLVQQEIHRLAQDKDQVYSPDALLDHLLILAAKRRASDIHLQPEGKSLHVSFRVDGVLHPVLAMPRSLSRLISAIKMRAKIDISDRRCPLDGSFSSHILDIPYDIRVSTVVTEYGENMVLRMLPGGMHVQGLAELGFLEKDVEVFKMLFAQPSGIILLTGPTGSGKSTTLHAGLHMHGLSGRNVLTVEDPIEYKLPVICQTEVNRKAGYTFDKAITHFLRHDPDIMLIGEIRDAETARVALTAAETGHLVLSTLHVNNVFGVVPRLESLGIHPQMMADSLIGAISQRLLRTICPQCVESYQPTDDELKHLNGATPTALKRGSGCSFCDQSGYHGRLPVYEMLLISRDLADQISMGAPRSALESMARDNGYVTMRDMAQDRVLRGETTVQEMLRVLGVEI